MDDRKGNMKEYIEPDIVYGPEEVYLAMKEVGLERQPTDEEKRKIREMYDKIAEPIRRDIAKHSSSVRTPSQGTRLSRKTEDKSKSQDR